ncbi:MAG: hypothetical protein ACKOB4_12380, partial [Acidobacteriota bacterium]
VGVDVTGQPDHRVSVRAANLARKWIRHDNSSRKLIHLSTTANTGKVLPAGLKKLAGDAGGILFHGWRE